MLFNIPFGWSVWIVFFFNYTYRIIGKEADNHIQLAWLCWSYLFSSFDWQSSLKWNWFSKPKLLLMDAFEITSNLVLFYQVARTQWKTAIFCEKLRVLTYSSNRFQSCFFLYLVIFVVIFPVPPINNDIEMICFRDNKFRPVALSVRKPLLFQSNLQQPTVDLKKVSPLIWDMSRRRQNRLN